MRSLHYLLCPSSFAFFFFFSSVGIRRISALLHENTISGTIKPIVNYERLFETIRSFRVTRTRVTLQYNNKLKRVFYYY